MSREKRRDGSVPTQSQSHARTSRRRMLLGFAFMGVVLLAGVAVGVVSWRGWLGEEPRARGEATFVGREVCASCHQEQDKLWQGSHHDLAMQVAAEATVLGDFNDATFTHSGLTSTFFKRDGRFLVRTEGPDGKLHEYEIAYTFGVSPLQQYLIAFPGGRYQALSIAWDARAREAGGQRWFHLYPDERIPPGDVLHWTRLSQNWNHMCAECHSTNLQKNYRPDGDRYETAWSEIDVSCEACHGPGSRHVEWVNAGPRETGSSDYGSKSLVVELSRGDDVAWIMDPSTGTAKRSGPLRSRQEVETCARCHSRRSVIHDRYVHGRPLMDTHRPALLEERLYHADGQIRDEVYVYGSLLQSKMDRAGVTCGDCHDPHSLKLRASGNALCAQCHQPTKFDNPAHHFHRAGSSGARCVECHMPAQTYMVIDPRRDHSLRVPRPDLSVKLGTPNACTTCHTDRSPRWAADAVAKWYGSERPPDFGEALHAGRRGLPGAERALSQLVEDPAMPAIARATAVSLLRRYLSVGSIATLERAFADGDPLVRMAALSALEGLEPRARVRLGVSLLSDPVRNVRIEAARILAPVSSAVMTPEQRAAFERALDEYRHAQRINADRPEAHLNLGVLHQHLGTLDRALGAYQTALRLDPSFAPAYVNLADLYRAQGRDDQGEKALRSGLAVAPNDAGLHHALGLVLVRQRRPADAIEALGRAAELAPDEPQYSYVYGVALHSTGEGERALAVLKRAHERHPGDRAVLLALATISRDRGSFEAAIRYAKTLVELAPRDEGAHRLLAELEAGQR